MSKLPLLEHRIKEKIQRVEKNVQPMHNKMYVDTLKIEVETLNWVLMEIKSLNNNSVRQK